MAINLIDLGDSVCSTCAYLSVESNCYNDNNLLGNVVNVKECNYWTKNPRNYPALYHPLKKTCRRCFHDILKTELIKEESGLYLCQSCNNKKIRGDFK